MKKKSMQIISLLIVISSFISMMTTGVFATNIEMSNCENSTTTYTFNEYVNSLNLDTDNITDISMGTVELTRTNNEAVVYATEDTSDNKTVLPAVIVTKENADGTITSSAYIELATDESGNLVSGINSLAMANDTTPAIQKVYSKAGFSITMEATYYQVKMTDYGQSGYAYAPSYSYFTISRSSATGTPTGCSFYTLLHGTYSVKNTDPTTRVQTLPQYKHTYSAGTPSLSYKYSFNDYSLYSNASYDYGGFSGELIHIPNGGQGGYYLKTEFTYGGTEYTLRYGIYNVSDLT